MEIKSISLFSKYLKNFEFKKMFYRNINYLTYPIISSVYKSMMG